MEKGRWMTVPDGEGPGAGDDVLELGSRRRRVPRWWPPPAALVPAVVALNRFITDTEAELEAVRVECAAEGVGVELCEVWEKGGEGGVAVADAVLKLLDGRTATFKPLYDEKRPIREKVETIAKEIYGAGGVAFAPAAERALEQLPAMGLGETPVCMAKTQYSFSDDPTKLGAPSGFTLQVRDILPAAGAAARDGAGGVACAAGWRAPAA